jgi:thioredoxin 1
MIFKGGEATEKIVGARSKAEFVESIEKHL